VVVRGYGVHGPEVFGDGDGSYVVALRLSDGEKMWERDLETCGGSVRSILDKGTLLVATWTGLAALDSETGKPLWWVRESWSDYESPTGIAVDEKHIYMSRYSGHVVAFHKADRTEAWERAWQENIKGFSLQESQIVVVMGDGPKVFALSVEDGRTLWAAEPPTYFSLLHGRMPAMVTAPPTIDAGRVLVASCDPRMPGLLGHMPRTRVVALALDSGQLVWKADLSPGAKIGIASDGRRVCLTSLLGEIVCIDGHTGRGLWETKVHHRTWSEEGVRASCLAAIISGQYVLVPTTSGELFCLSAISGRCFWRVDLGTNTTDLPRLLVAGRHLVVTAGREVCTFRPAEVVEGR